LALHSPKRSTKPGMACTPPNIPVSDQVRSTLRAFIGAERDDLP
jgi:hypothetical protein